MSERGGWRRALAALLLLAALLVPGGPVAARGAAARVPTILISVDGFRPDYLERGVTPVLSRLARQGATGPMRPAFPSKTFPNHWTLVTGLRPDRHGIVANVMEDARRPDEQFTMASDDPFWWNEAEPIWVAAERAGVRTATMFWPGSNVGWGGTKPAARYAPVESGSRPADWVQFNQAVTGVQRVNAVLDWLRRPPAIRPGFITLYFDTVDTAGHEFGPDDPRTNAAIAALDRDIGLLIDGLARLGARANLVIVADHGMAATSSARVIALDRIVDPSLYRLVEAGPYASFVPAAGREAALEAALLAPHPHMQCWRKGDVPARLGYGRHPRVPPYLCLADSGWTIVRTAPTESWTGGAHGYAQDAPDMAALFIGHGPAFRRGTRLSGFDNVAVYPLIARLLGILPKKGLDGDATALAGALRRR
ncbi:alkaline phosphatase family protein [Sphingomonas changnyeongensis]|uniref:Alkaline phosphatase family protein n=1 Tax=Sphingomonas changnyeongensis TaxID=2698679 RepID=A0A7Z2NVQ6_9SPHN|nr:ectonucleotide pyrophosphatase/phosphodiesterase [Sphingomonas changnyeongensis]QHL90650.1 alkaline phosphatase family protein [Sphingomonas changnyeongensis]